MLPITEMLEEEKKKLSLTEWFWFSEIINKVRTLEEASQKKAKEEERKKIVGIIEEMIKEINGEKDGYYDTKKDRINLLVELINRLEALPQEQITHYMNILRLNYLNSEKEERMSFHKLDDLNDCELFGMDIRDLLAQGATNIHIS